MTIEEILKAQGLTDEQIGAVIKSMDKNKLSVVAEGEENLTTRYGKLKNDFDNLTAQLRQSQINAAVQLALVNAKALDTDYLAYKLSEKGELELDESGNVKDLDDKIAALKTQYPTQFETSSKTIGIKEQRLPGSESSESKPSTLAEALQMQYENK